MNQKSSESSPAPPASASWLQRALRPAVCLFLLSLQPGPWWPRGSGLASGYVAPPMHASRPLSASVPLRGSPGAGPLGGRHGRKSDVFRRFESVSRPNGSNPASERSSPSEKLRHRLSVLWRFTRPHTIIGSALAIPALHLLAAPTYGTALTARSLSSMLYAMVPSLLMNLYITGLNQVTDVEIDKINKPDLPIASGDLSVKDARLLVVGSLVLSLALGASVPALATEGLGVALGVSAVLGTVYSLPPFRFKRFPLLAAFCIVAVRGAVINAGFFAHAHAAAYGGSGRGSVLGCLAGDLRCGLSSLYFAVFGLVIALMKDVPDVEGDALSNIRTASVRLGPSAVYQAMHRLLTGLFWGVGLAFFRGALAAPASAAVRSGRALVGAAALLAGASVRREASPVDPHNPREVYGFYMHLWKLFYLSYLFLPFAR
ncbi:unnamed protein product [Pseudo-nitzschia multistriata]|uniref:Uncharacterized protein n=1 Tax=Pseudo-nitzschia multistriata TaxID=183589 RepID=A0A448ZLS0_9STRA|nr:unnamed protein product [Pseudo-nitzschia multistriata]